MTPSPRGTHGSRIVHSRTDDLTGVVIAALQSWRDTEGSEIRRDAVVPDDAMRDPPVRRIEESGDLARVIDGGRIAMRIPRPRCHVAVVPAYRATVPSYSCSYHDLACVVDVEGTRCSPPPSLRGSSSSRSPQESVARRHNHRPGATIWPLHSPAGYCFGRRPEERRGRGSGRPVDVVRPAVRVVGEHPESVNRDLRSSAEETSGTPPQTPRS